MGHAMPYSLMLENALHLKLQLCNKLNFTTEFTESLRYTMEVHYRMNEEVAMSQFDLRCPTV